MREKEIDRQNKILEKRGREVINKKSTTTQLIREIHSTQISLSLLIAFKSYY